VGLPLSIAFAEHHDVLVYDIDVAAADRVRRGELPFKDEGAEQGLATALASGMLVSTTPEGLPACDTIVFVIGTPVDEHLNPSFTVFDRVLAELFEWLRDGQTLVLRSTVLPGTSERVHKMLERQGLRVDVAFCPERVAEGHALEEIRTLPQIVSAFSAQGVAAAKALFEPLGVELIELTPLEAELAKLFTNTYRYITFAVANQFYMVACDYDLDFYKVLHAVKHNYPRGADMPSAGFAAGPCLFKDTMQMLSFNDNQFFLGHSAMLVNEGLPKFVVKRMLERWPDLDERAVGLLGMAFKAESDDTRESLSYKLKKILQFSAREVLTCDPEVSDAALLSEEEVLDRADIFVIGAPHQRYKTLDYRGKPVVDVWNLLGKGGAI
jgi:UDP-N-acetyl-D-mannosaminuronic acid dehydrogenase